MSDTNTQTDAPGTNSRNHWRRSDKWMLGVGSASIGAGVAFILQMNGLYFTRNEGLNVKEDLKTLSSKVDANRTDVVGSINLLRIDMNRNFADMMLQSSKDQASQFRIDDKQNLEISELKLLLNKPKQKEN